MLFQMGLFMAFMSCASEIALVNKMPALHRLYVNGTDWNLIFTRLRIEGYIYNTIVSFILSYITGAMFGATGLVVMFAGTVSTALSQCYFMAESALQDRGHTWTSAFAEAKVYWTKVAKTLKDVWTVVYFVLRVITLPLRIIRAIVRGVQAANLQVQAANAKVRSALPSP